MNDIDRLLYAIDLPSTETFHGRIRRWNLADELNITHGGFQAHVSWCSSCDAIRFRRELALEAIESKREAMTKRVIESICREKHKE